MQATENKKVLVVLPSLGCGGAERIILSLCKRTPPGVKIKIAVIRLHGELLDEFSRHVEIVDLGGRLLWPVNLIRLARRDRPVSILSTIYDVNMVVLLVRRFLPRTARVVVRDAVMPTAAVLYGRFKGFIGMLYKVLYPRADIVVVLSEHMKSDLLAMVRVAHEKVAVIGNAVEPDRYKSVGSGVKVSSYGCVLATVGRLHYQKGYDMLIHVFSEVLEQYPGCRLHIVGSGNEEESLKRLVINLNIEHAVAFYGYLNNPMEVVSRADYFILSSRYEGLPNAMLEALCMGVPVIAVVQNTGADEFVRDCENGYLIRNFDREQLVGVIIKALHNPPRMSKSEIAVESRKRLSASVMANQYFKVLGCD